MKNFIILISVAFMAMSCGQSGSSGISQQDQVSNNAAPKVQHAKKQAADQANDNKAFAKRVAVTDRESKAAAALEKAVSTNPGQIIFDAARPLKWGDFKARPQSGFSHDAYTEAGIYYEPLDYNNEFVELAVVSYFDVNKSWVKPDKKGDYLLAHEQKHFEICEVYRRKLMKQLDAAQPIDRDKFNEVVKKYFTLNFNSMTSVQRQYDDQTMHSVIKKKQVVWNEKIQDELNGLSAYKDMKIKLMLK